MRARGIPRLATALAPISGSSPSTSNRQDADDLPAFLVHNPVRKSKQRKSSPTALQTMARSFEDRLNCPLDLRNKCTTTTSFMQCSFQTVQICDQGFQIIRRQIHGLHATGGHLGRRMQDQLSQFILRQFDTYAYK